VTIKLGSETIVLDTLQDAADYIKRVAKERDEARQRAGFWRRIAQRIFWTWEPKGDEYEHWVTQVPELGKDFEHLGICSKQSGKTADCPVCRKLE
jgi:hypothetical protein